MKKKLSVRERLGLTQQQMANFLGMDRSVYASYESGKRSLSVQALLKLSELEMALYALSEEEIYSHAAYQNRQSKSLVELEAYATTQALTAKKLEEKIAALKVAEKQCLLKLHVFSKRLSQLDPTNQGQAKEKHLLQMLIQESEAFLPSPTTIAILEVQEKALKAAMVDINARRKNFAF